MARRGQPPLIHQVEQERPDYGRVDLAGRDPSPLDRIIGQGGMGIVASAMHLQLREHVAIKFLLPEAAADENARVRFLREARSCARLKSEHVVRVIDFGVFETGSPVLVMEMLDSKDLGDILAHDGAFDVDTTVEYLLQACEAIAEAHARGIVHRDLKPSNLFLTTRADGTPLIKVVDFGVAKSPDVDGDDIVSQWATGKNTILGSPGYMSPEQVQTLPGIDSRTDIWSLGVILYEMLTGEFLFEAPSLAQALAGILMNPKPNLKGAVDVPESLDRLCSWCLEKDRNDRCPNVWEFAFLLVEAARAGTWSKSPRPGIKRGSKPSRLFASKRS